MGIDVGDTVYRTEFIGSDITTHPGMPGTVTRMRSSNCAEPDFAEVTFALGVITWYRTIRIDKLSHKEN